MKSILIVEDEKITVMMLRMLLERLNIFQNIIDVPSGEEALEIAAQVRPKIIIMDINLSKQMDGVEAVHRIKEIYDPVVLYSTGNSDENTLEKAQRTNPREILIKPISKQKLTNTILEIVNSGS